MRVFGIDPGSRHTGWGVVEEKAGGLALVDCGIINAIAGGAGNESFSARLAFIYRELSAPLVACKPDVAAIEQVFTAKNAQSALKLGQARGIAVAACAACGLEIYDYEPTLVKKSLVGAGRAEKEQVAFMVRRLLNIRHPDWPLDTTDALGVAICHLSHARYAALATKCGQVRVATHSSKR